MTDPAEHRAAQTVEPIKVLPKFFRVSAANGGFRKLKCGENKFCAARTSGNISRKNVGKIESGMDDGIFSNINRGGNFVSVRRKFESIDKKNDKDQNQNVSLSVGVARKTKNLFS